MITTIVVLAYVASIFVARWFNKKCYELCHYNPKWWILWFIPIIGVATFWSHWLCESGYKFKTPKFISWFIGDNW